MVQPLLDDDGDDAHDECDVVGTFQCRPLKGCPHVLRTLVHEPQSDHYQNKADEESRQCLVFAPAIAVTLIRTLAGKPHHRINQRIGHRVADRVDTVGQDGAGATHDACSDFKRRQGYIACHAYQSAPFLLAVAQLNDVFIFFFHL